jgi:DNA primase
MKVGNFSFPQAVEELAKRYGVRLPSRELSPAKKKEMAKREILFQINQMASEYFHDLLYRQREGDEGRRYLSQRGLSEKIIKEHRLGYSLERWDGLEGRLVRRFPRKDSLPHLRPPSTGRRVWGKIDQGRRTQISQLSGIEHLP